MSKKERMSTEKRNSSIPLKITDLERANKRIEELGYELKMQTIKMNTWKC